MLRFALKDADPPAFYCVRYDGFRASYVGLLALDRAKGWQFQTKVDPGWEGVVLPTDSISIHDMREIISYVDSLPIGM